MSQEWSSGNFTVHWVKLIEQGDLAKLLLSVTGKLHSGLVALSVSPNPRKGITFRL